MKAVLMSIQPKWCELIASGKKTIEIRKTKPKLDVPFKVYIYCTQNTPYNPVIPMKYEKESGNIYIGGKTYAEFLTGKVIGEFVCNGLTYIEAGYDTNGNKHLYNTAFLEHRMCIPDNELHKYLYKSRENSGGWAWHISDLVIYDKPKELVEFAKPAQTTYDNEGYLLCDGCDFADWKTERVCTQNFCKERMLTRPPQSWCYVEGE